MHSLFIFTFGGRCKEQLIEGWPSAQNDKNALIDTLFIGFGIT
jgi:hypothetical protein